MQAISWSLGANLVHINSSLACGRVRWSVNRAVLIIGIERHNRKALDAIRTTAKPRNQQPGMGVWTSVVSPDICFLTMLGGSCAAEASLLLADIVMIESSEVNVFLFRRKAWMSVVQTWLTRYEALFTSLSLKI